MKFARPLFTLLLALAICSFGTSCRNMWGSLEIRRDTLTSGTFKSTGWNLHLLNWDLPRTAMESARDNIADARLDNVDVQEMVLTPQLGPLDWLLEIIGMRFARIEGTWGWTGDEE